VNAALLSRSKVFVLKPLAQDAIVSILRKALTDAERGLGRDHPEADDQSLQAIARFANGDARSALSLLQLAVSSAQNPTGRPRVDAALLDKVLTNKMLLYDKSGEEHYNLMSALHKSMRNSDADASIYWLARMLEAGEDPKYVARRLIRFASEDIGNADPQALAMTVAAKDAVHFIGMPEGNTALAQAVLYLATAPKSNAVYMAYNEAADAAKTDFAAPVPLHIRNAPTKLMKQLDYGKGYKYAHDEPDAVANMDCLPDNLKGREFYKPTDFGFEKEITKRLAWWKSRRKTGDSGA
jgi:putative ATPase